MPGPAFHLQLLELSLQALNGGSAADRAKARLMTDHLQHARLGALGPDWLRHRPVPTAALDTLVNTQDLGALDADAFKALGQQIFPNPEMAVYGTAYRLLLPRLTEMQAINEFLARMSEIAKNEDVDGLKNSKAEFDALKPKIDSLKGLKDEVSRIVASGYLAAALGKPQIQGDKPGITKAWRAFEFLRWKRTAEFSRNLLKQAHALDDDALRAYAYGHLSHVAGAVTAEPFVNTIVGGPYRSHWWRNKWVRHHVDAWTFGRYRTPASMAGDTATPGYLAWRNLCGANLQDAVKLDAGLSGPAAAAAVATGTQPPTPGFDPVANLVLTAVNNTYGAGPAMAPPDALTDLAALRSAYVGTLSVLWFMTGDSVLCGAPPGAPPAGAETPPPWYGSGGTTPPPAPSGSGGGGSSTVSAVLAAILAVIAILAGSIVAAVAAIVLAIAAAESGGSIDWNALRGTIYWLQVSMFDAQEALRKMLVVGGLGYPMGKDLGDPPVADKTHVQLTKSRRVDGYPRQMDARGVAASGKALLPDMAYDQDPGSAVSVGSAPPVVEPARPVEQPATRANFDAAVYFDTVLDGTPLRNGGMLSDNGAFPTRDQDFGGAVANAVQIIQADAEGLPDYNLDADRGYGWKTWKPRLGTQPGDGSAVDAVEEA